MKMKLNDEIAQTLKGGPARIEYFDTSSPVALGLRVHGDRKTWFTRYRLGRRHVRYTIGPFPIVSYEEAFLQAAQITLAAREGRDPSQTKKRRRDAITVEELVEMYLEAAAPSSGRSKGRYELARDTHQCRVGIFRNHILPTIGRRLATDLTSVELNQLITRIAKDRPTMANMVHAVLSRLFRFARAAGAVEQSPMWGLERPTVAASRDRYLRPAEIKVLWEAAAVARDQISAGIIQTVLLTGQRFNEVRTMDLDAVESRWWRLGGENALQTKNTLRHTVYLADPTWDVISRTSATSRPSDGRLPRLPAFPNKSGCVPVSRKRAYDCLKAIRSELDIPYFRLHDLRHTFVTWCSEMEIEDRIQKALVNHKRGGTTARYDHARFMPARQQWFTRYADYVQRVASGDEAAVLSFPTQ
jgi:integrase